MLNKFLGKWRLLPARSIYPLGNPPLSCTYIMKYDDNSNSQTKIKWEMIFETFDHKVNEVKYEMEVNGLYSSLIGYPMVDEVMSELSTQEDRPSLDSYSKKDGKIIQISHRILLSDQELKIIQTFPQNNNLSNIQFYEKLEEEEEEKK